MKNILSLIIVSFTISCTSLKDFSNQEYNLIDNGKQKLIINKNQPLIEVSINEHKAYLLFDTGATTSIISDSIFFDKIKSESILKKTKSLTNASGVTLDAYKIITKKISSPIFDSKNIILSYYKLNKNLDNTNCKDTINLNKNQGIIGLNNLIHSEKLIVLNFDENSIEIKNENFDKSNFLPIEAKVETSSKKIIIPIILNKKKINFLFDTGNSGGLLVNEKEFKNSSCDFEGEMMIGNFNGFSTQKIRIYKNAIIKGLPIQIENQNITSFNPFLTNTMGMKFISKFNWLLDFKNKKIYIQKNKNQFEKSANEFNNIQVLAINNELIIGFKSKTISNYKIADKIVSVNNKVITPENVCEIQNLLNSTSNWDEFKIEIKKP
jgi:hypothetical protein